MQAAAGGSLHALSTRLSMVDAAVPRRSGGATKDAAQPCMYFGLSLFVKTSSVSLFELHDSPGNIGEQGVLLHKQSKR